MRFFFDTKSGQFVKDYASNIPFNDSLRLKRADATKIEFVPFREEGFGLATPYQIAGLSFGGFYPGAHGEDPLFGESSFTESLEGDDDHYVYTGSPDTNTLLLLARFCGLSAVKTNSGASYTLVLSDASKLVAVTHSSSIAVTVPTNASVAFPTGTVIIVLNNSTGQTLAVSGAGGVTLTDASSLAASITSGNKIKLTKTATDAWTVSAVDEEEELEVELEFSWTESAKPVSTPAIAVTIENDYLRENQGTPETTGAPSNYYTKSETDALLDNDALRPVSVFGDYTAATRLSMRYAAMLAPLIKPATRALYWRPRNNSTTVDSAGLAITEYGTGSAAATQGRILAATGVTVDDTNDDIEATGLDSLYDSGVPDRFAVASSSTMPGGITSMEWMDIYATALDSIQFIDPLNSPNLLDITSAGSGTIDVYRQPRLYERMPRKVYTSSASAGNACGLADEGASASGLIPMRTGYADELVGWEFRARFAITDGVSNGRLFVGMAVPGQTGNPSGWTNVCGIFADDDDTNLSFISGGASPTIADLGADFPVQKYGVYDVVIRFDPELTMPGSNAVTYEVRYHGVRIGDTREVAQDDSITFTVSDYVKLSPMVWRHNAATASAVELHIGFLDLETDL